MGGGCVLGSSRPEYGTVVGSCESGNAPSGFIKVKSLIS